MAGKSIGTTWPAAGGDFTPATRVLIEARRNGLAFDAAWPRAIAAVDPDDRATLHETATAWRLEYEGHRSWGGDLIGALAVLDRDTGQRHDQQLVA
jgi:hypothetical protein